MLLYKLKDEIACVKEMMKFPAAACVTSPFQPG